MNPAQQTVSPTASRSGDEDTPSVPQDSEPQEGYRYWGFISYSHSDDEWAKWLHRSLENYKIPRQLWGRPSAFGPLPRRLFPIFRDRDELPSASDLGAQLQNSLRNSRNLIVICSARSAVSRWVNEEIRTFKSWKREGRVFAIIVDGEPNASDNPDSGQLECFPPALRFRLAEDGELSDQRTEIIAADARPQGDGKSDALLKLLSGLLGVPFDNLKQRERARRRWAKIRMMTLVSSVVLFLGTGWLAVADAGLNLPGGESIRKTLDRHEASVFRPVPPDSEIRHKATGLRRELLDIMLECQASDGWMNATLKPREKMIRDVWTQGHTASSVLQAPDATREDRLKAARMLNSVFLDSPPIEDSGVKLGWLSHEADVDTIAEPSLWMSVAYASLLRYPELLSVEDRQTALQKFSDVQAILESYRPDDSGGWNMFPRQKDSTLYSTYSSSLALLALLETKRAGLPWNGSIEKRDQLLASTADWFCRTYVPIGKQMGWRANMASYEISDGLTLQIYYLLMRAESEAGFTIPPVILDQIPKHLIGCANRDLEFPIDQGEFAIRYKGIDGRDMVGKEAIGYLWHPWAIGASQVWLKSAERHLASPEDRVRVRRTLANLVINLGDGAMKEARYNWTFIPSEMLFNLSIIEP